MEKALFWLTWDVATSSKLLNFWKPSIENGLGKLKLEFSIQSHWQAHIHFIITQILFWIVLPLWQDHLTLPTVSRWITKDLLHVNLYSTPSTMSPHLQRSSRNKFKAKNMLATVKTVFIPIIFYTVHQFWFNLFCDQT